MGQFVLFRDCDLFYKRPWYTVTWREPNKMAYVVTDSDLAIYPHGYGLKRTSFGRLKRRSRIDRGLIPPPLYTSDQLDKFFSQNHDNPTLFLKGMHALGTNPGYFERPIKLPRLEPIGRDEFEKRWAKLKELILPVDQLFSIDTTSRLSRFIARVDHGPWSHVAGYLGGGKLCEATPPMVRLTDLESYRAPRYRLGLYRASDNITQEQRERFMAFSMQQVGKRYGYRKVLKLGLRKLTPLGRDPVPSQLTPNEMIIVHDLKLIHVV